MELKRTVINGGTSTPEEVSQEWKFLKPHFEYSKSPSDKWAANFAAKHEFAERFNTLAKAAAELEDVTDKSF